MLVFILCLSTLVGNSEAQCFGCSYCCEGNPPYCCSYLDYVGGTTISGMVFGILFLVIIVGIIFICLCMCLKGTSEARLGTFNALYINRVTRSCSVEPPPYNHDSGMPPSDIQPPPYTPSPSRTANRSPPPPYPTTTITSNQKLQK
ncbi:cysteine and tyrosine-rich protein 1 [Tachysurus fulvidraco]|uniref:cysteine and tyrosine-rich protein 1 n=1 Tax=Tachysurus fulvidraco TaxID=1234273 RepID=UPI000F4D646A|nr:cysteine and tyrosine-rich protein 1 [Tachysurus fulvidraco]